MKTKLYLISTALCLFFAFSASAQLQKGNVLVGGDISNADLNLNTGNHFTFNIDPKAAWFIRDNIALGGYVNFGINTQKTEGTDVNYGIGALARYYINDKSINVLKHTRFFLEANAGVEGVNYAHSTSTNGLGLGFGPGIAYFITPNVGLEGLVKYQGIVGFGSNTTSSDLTFNLGFQIYLPRKSVEKAMKNQQ